MAPEIARPLLAEQPWFAEFLADRGFQRSAPGTFTNGRATVRVDGSVLYAIPGDGSKQWRSELREAASGAVRQLLTVVLAAPSFLSQAQLDLREARAQAVETALVHIADSIKESPETHSGRQLRRFVWSLYNGHHVVNLWSLKSTLDSRHNGLVTEVFSGWVQGHLPEATLRRALEWSGELERWDTVRLTTPEGERLDNALQAVEELLRRTPPGNPQTRLNRADELLREVQAELRRTQLPND